MPWGGEAKRAGIWVPYLHFMRQFSFAGFIYWLFVDSFVWG